MSVGAYVVWDATIMKATDGPDGLPDRAIVPLIEGLRSLGYTTLQSCTGHFGESDGMLWIREAPELRWLTRLPNLHPFSRIQHVIHGPEGECWEFWWEPSEWANARDSIQDAYAFGGATVGERSDT
jgi:hypothetical protein